MKPGTGRRQQLILRALSDGTPRSCASIAEMLSRISAPAVHDTIAIMLTRHWVQEVGRNRHYQARVWTITDEGRRLIPAEYSRDRSIAGEDNSGRNR